MEQTHQRVSTQRVYAYVRVQSNLSSTFRDVSSLKGTEKEEASREEDREGDLHEKTSTERTSSVVGSSRGARKAWKGRGLRAAEMKEQRGRVALSLVHS